MVDQYIREFPKTHGEPRVMVMSRWYHTWPRGQSWAHAYHPWATVAALPFPKELLAPEIEQQARALYEQLILYFEPDLLHLGAAYHGDRYLSYDFLRRFKEENPTRRIVVRRGENNIGKVCYDLVPLVDMLYVGAVDFIRELQEATGCTNVKFLPAGVDPAVDHPIDVEKQIDLLFLGNHGISKQSRSDVLIKLDKEFEDLWIGGHGWGRIDLRHRFIGAYKGDFKQWVSRAKISLCLMPDEHMHLEMYQTGRVVQSLGTRTFVLTSYTPGTEKLFTRKVHLDWYTDYEELVDLIHYWLEHDEEREQVAQQGYEYVLKNYTLTQFAGQVLRDVGLIDEAGRHIYD